MVYFEPKTDLTILEEKRSLPLQREVRFKITNVDSDFNELETKKSYVKISYSIKDGDFTYDIIEELHFYHEFCGSCIRNFVSLVQDIASPKYEKVANWIGLEGTMVLDCVDINNELRVFVSERRCDINGGILMENPIVCSLKTSQG